MDVARRDEEDGQKSRELIETGSDIAGAAAGGALGLLGGPIGVAAGAVGGVVVTRTLKRVGAEIHDRVLASRQQTRAGATLAVAGDRIRVRLENAEQPRQDGFFESDGSRRTAAEELLEGTLLTAADAYEEGKVPLLGRLYANLAFDESVSPAHANYLLRLADRLTFRQLRYVQLFGTYSSDSALIDLDVARAEGDWQPAPDVVAELNEIGNLDIIGITQGAGGVPRPMSSSPTGSVVLAGLGRIELRPLGATLYRLMGLVEGADVHGLLAMLRPT